ncbi:MAG: AAA family ATPase [Planctomycetaceae bacterium]|nr:AAA family ATPase [Planctomycetaceae bacterium]
MDAGLNPAQREAVDTLAGPMLVLAGAGTGKTRVVTHRIANLIRHGTRPERILAVTFTRKAAGEMQERALALLSGKGRGRGKRGAPRGKAADARPQISTFHALCVQVLRRHITHLGYPAKFSICDRGDQESIARAALREIRVGNDSLKPGDMLAIVSGWKSRSVRPGHAASIAVSDREHLAAAAYRRYQTQLKARGAVDFDDLLLLTEELLTKHPKICREEARAFDQILIDEYQDTNGSQYRIVKSLAAPHRNLCVVGDDDQSIYAWRGAEVQHILRFARDWPEAKVIRLEENYRSTGSILKYANTLIAFNSNRHDKVLRPARGDGPRPQIMQLQTETEEAEKIVGEVARRIAEPGGRAKDFCILCRTNEQPRAFETELRRLKVPYVLLGGMSFFDRKEVRDLLSYLKVVDDPTDEAALLRIVNTPARGIGAGTIKNLVETAVAAGVPVWELLEHPEKGGVSPAARKVLAGFTQLIHDLQEIADRVKLENLVEAVVDRTRYREDLERQYQDPLERDARMASVEELINAAAAYQKGKKKADLRGFLNDVALGGSEQSDDKEKQLDRNAVALMTLHSAKGLEFPHVYMVGMEEGILPHKRTLEEADDSQIDEERRLCYVGVTRAQETLTLSFALTRRKWGKPRETVPSRFLFEMTGQAERAPRVDKGGNAIKAVGSGKDKARRASSSRKR